MMVLEFFVWGAWLPLVWPYMGELGFTAVADRAGRQRLRHRRACSAIFFGNQFADRNFAAEKFLAFCHLIGGLAMLGAVLDQVVPAVLRR